MTDTQADPRRARLLIEEAVDAAKPLIVQNEMVLHWRVERQLRTRIAAALQSQREAAAAEARRAAIEEAAQEADDYYCPVGSCGHDIAERILALAPPPTPQEEPQ